MFETNARKLLQVQWPDRNNEKGALKSGALANAKGPVASGEELKLLNELTTKGCRRNGTSVRKSSVLQLPLAKENSVLEPKKSGWPKEVSLTT